jgi:hypothetical protein
MSVRPYVSSMKLLHMLQLSFEMGFIVEID